MIDDCKGKYVLHEDAQSEIDRLRAENERLREMDPLDAEMPPISFIGHNELLNAGAWKMVAVAKNTNAPPEVTTWIAEHGKIALHLAYNEMRDMCG